MVSISKGVGGIKIENNYVHDNSIVKIDDPEDALCVEDGDGEQNTLFSNSSRFEKWIEDRFRLNQIKYH